MGVLLGANYGKWTVLSELPRKATSGGRSRPRFHVRCACGTESEGLGPALLSGQSPGCRHCARRRTPPGAQFDRLTVKGHVRERDRKGHTRTLVDCLCVCGNRVLIREGLLRRNKTNNCGCAPRGAWSGVGPISTTFFNRQKAAARKRGLEFNLTHDQLVSLYEKQGRTCALSGLPINFSVKTAGRNTASLDRIDSKKGYNLDNVQWVHRDVNLMKLDFTLEEFVTMCRRIGAHVGPITAVLPRERLPRGAPR